jgi:hypothetical protein
MRCLFGLLEHDCETLDECFIWVARALSDAYQLRTIYIGDDPRQFFLEPINGRSGDPVLETGFGLLPTWWRKSTTQIRKNALQSIREVSVAGAI